MVRNVLVTITGRHSQDGSDMEPVTLTGRGEYFFKNGNHYVLCDAMGVEASAGPGRLKFRADYLQIRRTGAPDMLFEPGKRSTVRYSTGAGELVLETAAGDIDLQETEQKILVKVCYEMYAGGVRIQDSLVEITVIPYPIL